MEPSPIYINPDQISDTNNVRLRHSKSNSSTQSEHVILNTDDFPLTDKEINPPIQSKYRHKKSQICFLVLTALSYVLHTLRSFISEDMETSSHFWSSIKPPELVRAYTSEMRPDSHVEDILFRFVEISQTFCCIYILSFIFRSTHLGYLYRNPNIFNRTFCLLLLFALAFQILSQMSLLPPEIGSGCLLITLILLIISSRLIAIKLIKYDEKLKTFDRIINRYFILNILFLYTTFIAYQTICSSIECIAFHLDLEHSTLTTIGFSLILFVIILYYIFDRFVYSNEFQSIYTPYLFLAVAFHCPVLRSIKSLDNEWNYYYLWLIFILLILIVINRLFQRICRSYHEKRIKYVHQTSLEEKSNTDL